MYAHCDGRLRHARREWSMEPLHGMASLCMSRLKAHVRDGGLEGDAHPTYCLAHSSILSTYLSVPMMSSRYSNSPVSCGVTDLGFIMEICSTSPCFAPKIRFANKQWW